MRPIYEPKGKAKEYGDYALNIYTGCPHRCYYCFAPTVLHKDREAFHANVNPRPDIVRETKMQIIREHITGKLIHLCFSCDPYPTGYDTSVTREIIKLLKEYGNHVQILTKGDGSRDFDLLDSEDWYGITISCNTTLARKAEPGAVTPLNRMKSVAKAHKRGIKTWVSFEPVLETDVVLSVIAGYFDYFDKIMVGKLNYYPSGINWAEFGRMAENTLKQTYVDYYIKESLRAEMEKAK